MEKSPVRSDVFFSELEPAFSPSVRLPPESDLFISFGIQNPESGIRGSRSAIQNPGSGIRGSRSAIQNLGSGIRGLRSAIQNPGSGIQNPKTS